MNCPKCKDELLPSIRENIEIDCCPRCGGIWLDHGELWELITAYAPEMVKHQAQQVSGVKDEKAGSLRKVLTSTGNPGDSGG